MWELTQRNGRRCLRIFSIKPSGGVKNRTWCSRCRLGQTRGWKPNIDGSHRGIKIRKRQYNQGCAKPASIHQQIRYAHKYREGQFNIQRIRNWDYNRIYTKANSNELSPINHWSRSLDLTSRFRCNSNKGRWVKIFLTIIRLITWIRQYRLKGGKSIRQRATQRSAKSSHTIKTVNRKHLLT